MFTELFHALKEKFMPEPEKLSPVEAYRLRRIEMEKKFTADKARPDPKEIRSPSGRYLLRITAYEMGKGFWDYTRGEVFDGEKLVADVKRNYGRFPFAWVEDHPNGHSYLLAGEDYQGQTVIELDTGKRADSGGTEETMKGFGFCWVAIHPAPDRKVVAVDGCYWAAPYEVVLFDFSQPLNLPHPVLERWDEAEGFEEWKAEGKLLLSRTIEVRKSDGKILDHLPDEELDKAEADGDVAERKITKLWEPKSLSEVRS